MARILPHSSERDAERRDRDEIDGARLETETDK